ncbi:TusE/DsrC/DsvC family sulfur relay protein [Kaarinaea lacus]
MKAKLIQTEGEWAESIIDTEQGRFFVIDEFSYGKEDVGKEFDIRLLARSSHPWQKWKEIAGSNPEKKDELVHVNYSYYRCYGKVVSLDPLIVECNSFQVTDPFSRYNSTCMGKYVCLDVRLYAKSTDIKKLITESGYLGNIEDWTPQFVEFSANRDGLTLTEDHWVLIKYIHEYGLEHDIAPSLKTARKDLGTNPKLSDRLKRLIMLGRKKFYTDLKELFPDGVNQMCKYAGLSQITGE